MPHLCSVYGQVTSICSQGDKKILGLLTKPKIHARYDSEICLDASGLTYKNQPWKGAWLANMDRDCLFFRTLSEAEAAVNKYDLEKAAQARADLANHQASNKRRPPTAASPKPRAEAKAQHLPAISASPLPSRTAAAQASTSIAAQYKSTSGVAAPPKKRGRPPKAKPSVVGQPVATPMLHQLTRASGIRKSPPPSIPTAQRTPASQPSAAAMLDSLPRRSQSNSPGSNIILATSLEVPGSGSPKTHSTAQTLATRPVARGSTPSGRSPRRRRSIYEGSPEWVEYQRQISMRQKNNWQPGL